IFMKMIPGLIVAAMLATGVMAQVPPSLPPTPEAAPQPEAPAPQPPVALPPAELSAPVTNKPAKKATTTKKKTAKKKVPATKKPAVPVAKEITPAAPLIVNEPAEARQNNVNIRGQANINSEVIARLKQGETVTVLEEVTLKHPKTDEPAKWAKITLPATAHAWVNKSFLDANKAVVPAKLNLRSGAGENYSVIGLLHKGDTIKEVGTKGDWTEIEAPAGAYAFVAAHLLTHKEAAAPVVPPVIPAPIPTPAPTPAIVENTQPVVPAPTDVPVASTTPSPVPPINPAPVPDPLPLQDETPAPPRIIEREGIVGNTVSIQAPSHYQLESLDNGKVIDYLYTTSTNVALGRYKGMTVLVTGEEGLDERWPNTPVITIQKIQVVQ
ncbi:MAG: type 3 domain protein, partial [Pedosphaera sp.]|nr:type 3 domain protein [Pedosphaera sp.]